ncbi:FGGY family carbohydrate kinase [Brachybacterium sp. Z12]|uniref:FGGY family carbohydrate kinase n=1 Tax=Brachybacterium sp. Z12 TaxID=2759167 RepID=UPI00223BD8ED|nr:FGGY family carbohydrate kinase [Brachybacterium sp. Z12]
MVPDLLGYLLTGQRRTERTNASSTGMLAVGGQGWSEELLTAAGVDPDLLAPLISPASAWARCCRSSRPSSESARCG